MTEHFNKLTPKQAELLTLLEEECAEVIQAITKIQRHGLDSGSGEPNVTALHRELGDVHAAVKLLLDIGLIEREYIEWYRDHKLIHVGKYLHHVGDEQ
jgi:NTP pyrophosphatase (non-canonical NTP hydrolase)